MKKTKILSLIFIFIFIYMLGLNRIYASSTSGVAMVDGASIRTSGNQGIKFSAKVDVLPTNSTHGFYIAKGEHSYSDMTTAINDCEELVGEDKLVNAEVIGSDLNFSVVIYNIDSEYYESDITAISYVKLENGTYEFSSAVVTRNILEVAYNAVTDGNDEWYVMDIYHTKYSVVKYNLNYKYNSVDEIAADLLADFNSYASTSYTLDTLLDCSTNATNRIKFSQFIGSENYHGKWYWFFDYLVRVRESHIDEIEQYATENYNAYIANNNKVYYTPWMRSILDDGYQSDNTAVRLLPLEVYGFFTKTGNSYWSAHTMDWSNPDYYDIINDVLYTPMSFEYKYLENDATLSYSPVRTGYTFAGWFTGSLNGDLLYDNITIADPSNEELYAAWTIDNTILVDDDINEDYDYTVYNKVAYRNGVTAFKTISEAIAVAKTGDTIYVNDGEYNENITINKNNIKLKGVNADKLVNESRDGNSIIKGKITIASGVSGLEINGFDFREGAQIVNTKGTAGTAASPATNLNGFTFSHNVVWTTLTSGNGFIYFVESASSYSHDLVFDNNVFDYDGDTESTLEAFVYLDNLYNLTFTNNRMIRSPKDALHVNDQTKGVSGQYAIVKNNEFYDIGQNAIHFNWISVLPASSKTGYIEIENNIFENIDNKVIYLGKINNGDEYDHFYIKNNEIRDYYNGIEIERNMLGAEIDVTENTFYGEPNNFIIKLNNPDGTSNPKSLNAMGNGFFDLGGYPLEELNTYMASNIEYSTKIYYVSNDTDNQTGAFGIDEIYQLKLNVMSNITWSSSNPLVAIVDEDGYVTGVSEGNAVITATHSTGSVATIGLTVYDKENTSDLMNLLIANNNSIIWNKNITYKGSKNYVNNVNASANKYWAGTNADPIDKMLPTTRDNYSGLAISNLYFITIHDTGSSEAGNTANNQGSWCVNSSNTSSSWHYTIGNDGIYHHVANNIVAWHAGDGRTAATLYNTGIEVGSNGYRYRPTITLGEDGYFYLDGEKTLVKYPSTADSSTGTNTVGMACVIKDGYYYIPTSWVTSSYGKVVAAHGGNMNSIGIETCVNNGSDVYLTWQKTAKFVAGLLVEYNLTPDRVLFHNNFSNKTCPNTMISAGLTDEFLDMVYVEWMVQKYYSDYEITFTSSNLTYLNNQGRVVTNPAKATSIAYTISITKDANTESITLYSIISEKNN